VTDSTKRGREMSSMQLTVTTKSTSDPDDVYALLADVQSHSRWASENQFRPSRLVEVRDEPSTPAHVHDTWSGTGRVPMHLHRWEDR
jgi:hypothetical protein